METLKFKTNINCGGCVAAVTPALNGLKNIQHWEVDTGNPDKVLTVKADDSLKAAAVIDTLKQKGYNAIAIA
jgi:copper chaperone